MIDKDEGEILAYVETRKNIMDNAIDKLVTAAGKGTKLDSKIYYEMMENREQIVSIKLKSASSAMPDLINYYFQTIEDLLDRPYINMMKTIGKQNIPPKSQVSQNSLITIYLMILRLLNTAQLNGILSLIQTPLKSKYPTAL